MKNQKAVEPITHLDNTEHLRRAHNSEVFELHSIIYCNRETDYSTFKELAREHVDNLPDGYVYILDRNAPVLEVATRQNLLDYVTGNCGRNFVAGIGSKYQCCLKYKSTTPEGFMDTITLSFSDKGEARNPERLIILNQDETGNVVEAWVNRRDEIEFCYASETLSNFYWSTVTNS